MCKKAKTVQFKVSRDRLGRNETYRNVLKKIINVTYKNNLKFKDYIKQEDRFKSLT